MSADLRDLYSARRWLLVFGFVFFLVGCISKVPVKPARLRPEPSPEGRTIQKIAASENKEGALVAIEGNRPLTYTAVKHQFPLAVALYFRDTALEGVEESYTPASTVIKAIEASELKRETPSSRIEILLNEDLPYEVTRAENEVRVHFRKPVAESEEVAEAEEPLEAEVVVEPAAEAIEVAEEMAPEMEEEPAAEAIEVVEEMAPEMEEEPAAEAIEVVEEMAPEMKEEPGLEQEETKPEKELIPKAVVEAPTTEAPERPNLVNLIHFEMLEAGKSRVTVGTTGKMQCETDKVAEKRILLKLPNTRIPAFHKLPLITTRFKSAVDRILPIQTPDMGDRAVVAIELREAVPYRVEQKEKMCLVEFESSAIPPRPTPETERPAWIEAMKEAEVEVIKEVAKPPEEPVVTETGKVYTGEKISLDFQDAEIRNVFRILHEVSGKNFIIGDTVKGKVTLKLVDVPWDQVLDLVLKMNKLGTVVEGNVVRIATLDALADEERALQEKRRAEQEAEEQERLVTGYIPINYADASVIKAHLDEIKTTRGKVTFDERTNTIIIKDTEEIIKRARELAKRLDKVTPQVLIEANIVEASSDFSREMGIQWGGEYGIWPGDDRYGVGPQRGYDDLGGTYGLRGTVGGDNNYVVNLPATGPTGGIGFNFARLTGTTPLTLQANLQAMESQGKGKILSNPKILTLDNKEAYIKQGTNIPYQVLEEGSYSLKWQEAVLELLVTPHVTADNRISMLVEVKKDSPDNSIVVQGAPAVDKKEASTELMVNNGDTIVIGGIITKDESFSQGGLPGLSKLPVLGWLFKSESMIDNRREVLIFVTPTLIQLEPAEATEDIMLSQLR